MENNFTTSDLGLAAAVTLFSPILQIDKTNLAKVEFIFGKNEKLVKIVEKYWNNELQVNPLAYFQQLKILKARIYEGRTYGV